MLDHHLHVWRHEPGTPTPTLDQLAAYCDAAEARGVQQIAITEHVYRFDRVQAEVLPHWARPLHGPVADATAHVLQVEGGADLDAYVQALLDAQAAGLPLLVGMEVDGFSGATEAMASVLDDYPFDILLGSVHWLDEWLFDAYGTEVFAAEWERRDTDDVFAQYVDAVLALANSGTIDVLAHVDVIKVAGHRPPRLADHEQRLVRGLATADVAVELSSGGLRKPVADTYPGRTLFARLVDEGVGFTTASDGHSVDQVGMGFDQLRSAMAGAGLDELVTFARRERVSYAVEH